MNMNRTLLSLIILFLGLNTYGNSLNLLDDKELVIENNEIKSKGEIVGKIKIEKVELSKEKIQDHFVKIFNKNNELIASYLVTASTNQKECQKKPIIQASLKTYKDNVTHMGSNFLNYNESESEPNDDKVPQFSKVVKYLIDNRYM